MSAIAPQAVGGRGPIPFWAASHEVIFDAFTTDSFTPAGTAATLFNGALSQVKPYPFLKALWVKCVGTGGSAGGTVATDYPGSIFSTFRFSDPNGHAIIDTDGTGLWWLAKYGGYSWIGDPKNLTSYSSTAATPQASFLIPFEYSTLGVGSLPNMDASGPYRIFAQGNTAANVFLTSPTTTRPSIACTVGLEAWSLPGAVSRVNGAAQVQAPPPLDRGVVLVREYTKQIYSINSGGGIQTFRLTRVGNILAKLILVLRDNTGARISWLSGTGVASGTTMQLAFDTNPLFQADPQHLIERMQRIRTSAEAGSSYDTGVLVLDFDSPTAMAIKTDAFDGGMDSMLQTAQSTSLELTVNFDTTAAGAGHPAGGTLEVYTLDVTATTVTGQPYSFAYAGQLLAPTPPGQIRS